MIGKIFKHLDKKSIEKIANNLGGTVPRELLFLTYDKMEFDNFMSILEINAQRFGVVNHKVKDGSHTLNIHHGISDNFSYFLGCAHKKMADDLSLKIKVTNSDESVLCTLIEEPKVEY